MGTVNIAINGRRLFEWEGGPDEIDRTMDAVARLAAKAAVSEMSLTQSAVLHIAQREGRFLPGDGVAQETQMMMLLWFVLSQPTQHPDHPGLYRDYVPVWDFDFNIMPDPSTMTVEIEVLGAFGDIHQA